MEVLHASFVYVSSLFYLSRIFLLHFYVIIRLLLFLTKTCLRLFLNCHQFHFFSIYYNRHILSLLRRYLEKMKKIHLDELPLETTGMVDTLNCNGAIRRRLLDLGIVKGTKILPILKSPSGDPTAFLIRGSVIALRKEDANLILVNV